MPTSNKLAAAVAMTCAFLSTASMAGTPILAQNSVLEPSAWALIGLAAAMGFLVTRSKGK